MAYLTKTGTDVPDDSDKSSENITYIFLEPQCSCVSLPEYVER